MKIYLYRTMYGRYICLDDEENIDAILQFIPRDLFTVIKSKSDMTDDYDEIFEDSESKLDCQSYFAKNNEYTQPDLWYNKRFYNPCFMENLDLILTRLNEMYPLEEDIFLNFGVDITIGNPDNPKDIVKYQDGNVYKIYNDEINMLNELLNTNYRKGVIKFDYDEYKNSEGHIYLVFFEISVLNEDENENEMNDDEKEGEMDDNMEWKLRLNVVDTGKWNQKHKKIFNNTLHELFDFTEYKEVEIIYTFDHIEDEFKEEIQEEEDNVLQTGYCVSWSAFFIFNFLYKNVSLHDVYYYIFQMPKEIRAFFIYIWWDIVFRTDFKSLMDHQIEFGDIELDNYEQADDLNKNIFIYINGEQLT